MLAKNRVVKITDFGIAKSFGNSQNTGNNILGTMDFMSPEQAKGDQVTSRSDIYSLGTVLYTLLSGKPPFTANSIEESFRNLTRIPAPYVSSVVPDVPHEVDRLIRRMMEKKPEKRIATAQAALHQIKEAEQQLKSSSEAKTAQIDPADVAGSQTSVIGRSGTSKIKPESSKSDAGGKTPSKSVSKKDTSISGKTEQFAGVEKTRSADPNETFFESPGLKDKPDSDDFSMQEEPEPMELDFFNTVTDEERQIVSEESKTHWSKGAIPLLLGLLAVVAIAVAGTIFSLRNPSADELYSQIDTLRLKPEKAVEQTEQFVSLYPDDERIEEVRSLNQTGKAIDFYHDLVNKLSVRARIPGESRMTEIEDQFHDIVRLADNNMKAAGEKMEAFIFVHDGNEDLDSRDRDCVDAAKGFLMKFDASDAPRIEQRIANIRATVKRAEQMVSASDAMKVYRSLIQLHQDENWGDQESVREDLLADLTKRIEELSEEDE